MDYIYIDKTSKKPIYRQIADSIEEAIDERKLVHHYHLPTEKEIADMYNLSLGVVKKAFVALEETGKVWRTRGKGSYVVNRSTHIFSPKDLRLETSTKLPFETMLIESLTESNFNETASKYFDCHSVFHCFRLHKDYYYAVVLEESYLDESYFRRLVLDVHMDKTISEILLECPKCEITKQENIMSGFIADSKYARMFEIEVGSPMIKIESVMSNAEDKVVAIIVRYLPSEFTIMESDMIYA